MGDQSYDQLKGITDAVYAGTKEKFSAGVLSLLNRNKIFIRRDDGVLHSVNISIPITRKESILIGLRYKKENNTLTEDHFLFEYGKPIQKFYLGKLEKTLPEYKGSHKAQ